MKLRTKLTRMITEREEIFDGTSIVINRYVEFTATADTKEEAVNGIDSLRNYIEDETGFSAQRCYCCDEVKQNKKGKWVAWEFINCLRDLDDYELIKEAYDKWKELQ